MDDLVHLLKQPAFDWLVERLTRRFEQGKPVDRGTVSLRSATPAQRRAIDDLLGRKSTSGASLTVDLAQLTSTTGADLAALIQEIRGPLRNLRAERDADAATWDAVLDRWRKRLRQTPDADWLEGVSRDGLLKRLAGRDARQADALLANAWAILGGAPQGNVLLAALAARVTGDSHALDRGRPLATLCLRGIHVLHGIDGQRGGAARREAWEAIGVTVDDLSAPVLCLNLPVSTTCELAPWIDWHVGRGEPYYLSWRTVRLFDPNPNLDRVFVCENPAIVSEAASRLGSGSRPLICTQGVPVSSLLAFLGKLAEAGVVPSVRADFDWAGLRIVDRLLRFAGARPWRMTVADYQACNPSRELKGAPCAPAWATDLAAAMTATGLAAYEEEMIDLLVQDLPPI